MYKPEWLSVGAEHLLKEWPGPEARKPYDVVIVGSGYGGAVAAKRLSALVGKGQGKGGRMEVVVLERGREHVPGTFPSSFSELPGHIRFSRFDNPTPMGSREGLFDFRIGKDVSMVVANGLGGGSLINAGVAAKPERDVFATWPKAIGESLFEKDKSEEDYFDRAKTSLSALTKEGRENLPESERFEKLTKHIQFQELFKGISKKVECTDITVDPKSCQKCGDCATGCNFGAKKTLSKTYLETAYKQGAEFYTGATVSHLEKRGDEWAVFVGLTTQPHPIQENQLREIRATTVILAAGALGSTEILMRSRRRHPDLALSHALGTRFSTNGDIFHALFTEKDAVNCSPEESSKLCERKVGPTITGSLTCGDNRSDRVVIEEMAIPGALRRVFEEVVTTARMLKSFGSEDTTGHKSFDPSADAARFDPRKDEVDPLAVDPKTIDRCQIFAAMGDDGAKGRLEPVPGWDNPRYRDRVNDGAIRVDWPRAGECPIFARQAEVFREVGGDRYLPNPLWEPLPKEISGALQGEKPTGVVFTVHPLGGCPMGETADEGVVNHIGQVFDPSKERKDEGLHKGLFVLDGSIVPTALGTNPLLTITALAERALDFHIRLLKDKDSSWEEPTNSVQDLPEELPIAKEGPATPEPGDTGIDFSERLTGSLSFEGGRSMNAELTLKFDCQNNLRQFLCNPNRKLNVQSGVLRIQDPSTGKELVDPVHVKGSLGLLVRGKSTPLEREKSAICAYIRTRLRDAFDSASKITCIQKARGCVAFIKALRPGGHPVLEFLKAIPAGKAYVDLASQIGEVRHLVYELTLQEALELPKGAIPVVLPKGAILRGQKTLRYAADANPWRQLVDLDLSAKSENGVELTFKLGVDMSYFFEGFRSRLAIAKQRDLPSSWMDLISLALFVARIILKIHFWSFRLPDYQPYDVEREQRRLPGKMNLPEGTDVCDARRYVVGYPETPEDEPGVFPLLTRYSANAKNPGRPVLLIHGLGSGGIQFATERAHPSLARHLVDEGFDVWVAELRTSIALPSSLDQWTIDEVARGDIPRLVDFVLAETSGKEPEGPNGERATIDVVAHCIGSAMFCTAVLDGKLQYASGESKIGKAALLQVGPLITLSKGTRLRCLAVAPLRRFLPDGLIDFSVDKRANWVESMIDRLLATYPYPEEEARYHELSWFGEPDRHIANCNRWAAIDGRMILHKNMSEEMLEHLGEILGQSSMTIWGQTLQYAVLERLTDSNGINAYVTPDNVRRYFTFPVRFLHGEKNDVFHPLTSHRSVELLKRIHGKDHDAEYVSLPEYAHLDPLIGEYACRDVFTKISGFFNAKKKIEEQEAGGKARGTDVAGFYVRRPLIGPVVGWLRPDPNAKPLGKEWVARTWCRLDDLRSPASFVLVAVRKGGDWVGEPRQIDLPTQEVQNGKITSLASGPFDTNLCVDVELLDGPGTYEIIILSAHESRGEPPSEEHLEAERDAGKRESAAAPHLMGNEKLEEAALETLIKNLGESDRKQQAEDSYEDKEKLDRATVEVPKDAESDSVTFAVASCRYPGWMPDRDRADATFGELLNRLGGKKKDAPSKTKLLEDKKENPLSKPRALFLVGDQIYADATAGAFDPKDARERFYEAYREAWTAPNGRNVLSRLPTYMMLDDHEVGDNWHPGDFLEPREQKLRDEGLKAFANYQWVHSPGNESGQPELSKAGLKKWYYDFELQGFPVYVCDTRTGRQGKDWILDEEQFKDLKDWLENRADKNRPKFIVSPSVVVPFVVGTDEKKSGDRGRSDGWDAFPEDLKRLFQLIYEKPIDNVVFLCGDPHISMEATISFFEDKDGTKPRPLNCRCFVASPMYAPYPFANGTSRDYLMKNVDLKVGTDRRVELNDTGAHMRYEAAVREVRANFCLVTARRSGKGWSVDAEFLHEAGSPSASSVSCAQASAPVLSPGTAAKSLSRP